MSDTRRRFAAVVFDFGGVIISPITEKLTRLAERKGVPAQVLLEVLMGPAQRSTVDHPWHRAERGELPTAEIQELVGPWAAAAGIELDGDEMDLLFDQSYRFNHEVLDRVGRLRAEGYRTALLTNSVAEFRPVLERDVDLSLFDTVVDSSEVGARKPEAAIFRLTTERLGVDPARVLFLDDFVWNVEAARSAGWTVIHVGDVASALAELDRLLES